jgi:hypothetical protein
MIALLYLHNLFKAIGAPREKPGWGCHIVQGEAGRPANKAAPPALDRWTQGFVCPIL